MSRIGKKIIEIPEKVEIKIDGSLVKVKGPKGELELELARGVKLEPVRPIQRVQGRPEELNGRQAQGGQQDKTLEVKVKDENEKRYRSMWGTFRQLVENMIVGVTEGWEKQLEINGVGYKAEAKGKELVLNVGYSHPVNFKVPESVEVKVEKNIITVSGMNKQLVGETAAQIRKVRKPEPYKGKGIKYVDEVIRRKAGKQMKGAGA